MNQDKPPYLNELPPNPYAPPSATVRDVAGPATAMTLAGRGGRLVANIVDGAYFLIPYCLFIAGTVFLAPSEPGGESRALAVGLVLMLLAFAGFVVLLVLNLRQMKRTGQSLGKKVMKIKVVRTDGSPASLGLLVWKRNVLNWVLSAIPVYGLVDILFIFGDARQCLHDKLAGTKVVDA